MPRTVVECPSCSQKLRVPDDRGSIMVTCGSCSLKWMWEPVQKPEKPVKEGESSGILSWFSKAKGALTGSSADVYLQPLAEGVRPGEALELQIDVHVSDFDLSAKEVKVELIGEEIVFLPWHSVRRAMGAKFDAARDTWNQLVEDGKFSHHETTFEAEYRAAGKVNWEANAQGEFKVNLEVPSNAVPSFQGRTIASQWRARAIVSTSGVSPKSDWILINVEGD